MSMGAICFTSSSSNGCCCVILVFSPGNLLFFSFFSEKGFFFQRDVRHKKRLRNLPNKKKVLVGNKKHDYAKKKLCDLRQKKSNLSFFLQSSYTFLEASLAHPNVCPQAPVKTRSYKEEHHLPQLHSGQPMPIAWYPSPTCPGASVCTD